MHINQVTVFGDVVDEPVFREVGTTGVLKITVKTEKPVTKKDGSEVTINSFHKVEVWGKRASALNGMINVGDPLFVQGEIKYGKYENKEGQTVYTTDISVGYDGKIMAFPSGGELVKEVADDDNPFN